MITNGAVTEAIEYILTHTWDTVTLEEVAEHCHMSVSYFSKIFREQTGQSVYAFIKKMKMEQSALKLKMEVGRSITDIGADYGYSASNYSSAFSQFHKMSPSAFRSEAAKKPGQKQQILEEINEKVRVEIRPDHVVMYERTIGNYEDMEKAWCLFVEKYKKDIDENTKLFERTFDDPTITDIDHCIYDICMETDNLEKYQNIAVIRGGKYVVYPFQGYIKDIYEVNQKLIGIWFPANHYEIDERYSYDQYYKVEQDGYMEFDICIPVK